MKQIALKLAASLIAMPLSLFAIGLTHNGWFFSIFMVSLPLAILYWMDFGEHIRNSDDRRLSVRTLGFIMGVPQALFGLLCAGIGLAIVVWGIYNTFIERQPEYSGGFMTLGIGPALILFGAGWLVTAFRRNSGKERA